jgi:23S rRNA (pseudouridine1915-N3)-methyltransferase
VVAEKAASPRENSPVLDSRQLALSGDNSRSCFAVVIGEILSRLWTALKFRLICVGRPAAGPLRDAIAEYESRVSRYWPFEVSEVKAEQGRSRTPSDVRRIEGERLLEKAQGTIVAVDERGRSMPSEAFAKWVTERRDRAEDTTFVIGGAFGLDDSVRQRASLILSLAPWTLQHELARLVLGEQLYRAGTIQRGEPYHKSD